MVNLMGTLGLDQVSADPNDLPVGKYDVVVLRSEYVLIESKGSVSHVITYQVEDGEFKGSQKQQWYTLYTEVVNAEGNFPEKVEDIKNAKKALSEAQARWYKKLHVDLLGVSEDQVSQYGPETLVGKKATIGVAAKNGYKNVSFVEPRHDVPAAGGFDATPGMPSF